MPICRQAFPPPCTNMARFTGVPAMQPQYGRVLRLRRWHNNRHLYFAAGRTGTFHCNGAAFRFLEHYRRLMRRNIGRLRVVEITVCAAGAFLGGLRSWWRLGCCNQNAGGNE